MVSKYIESKTFIFKRSLGSTQTAEKLLDSICKERSFLEGFEFLEEADCVFCFDRLHNDKTDMNVNFELYNKLDRRYSHS
jgi:hypothetical protein